MGVEGLQDGRHHLGHGSFAIAASHGNQRQRKLGAPSGGQLGQSPMRVRHFNAGKARQISPGTRVAYGRHCTAPLGIVQPIVGIKALTLKR